MKNIFKLFTPILIILLINNSCVYSAENKIKTEKPGFHRVGSMKMDFPYRNTTILMKNGNVLLTKGSETNIYNSKNKVFKKIKSSSLIDYPCNINLDNGNVLRIGSKTANTKRKYTIIELFDVNKETFKLLLKKEDYSLADYSCINLHNGKIFINRGTEYYIYDYENNILSNKKNIIIDGFTAYPDCNCKAELVLTKKNNVLLFGVPIYNNNDKTKKLNYIFEYNPKIDNFTVAGELKEEKVFNLKVFQIDEENIILISGKPKDKLTIVSSSEKNIEKYNIKTRNSEIIGQSEITIDPLKTQVVLMNNNKLLYNHPSPHDNSLSGYKPYVYNLNTKKSEVTAGSDFNGAHAYYPSLTKLNDGSILFSGGGTLFGFDSAKSYRYIPNN